MSLFRIIKVLVVKFLTLLNYPGGDIFVYRLMRDLLYGVILEVTEMASVAVSMSNTGLVCALNSPIFTHTLVNPGCLNTNALRKFSILRQLD